MNQYRIEIKNYGSASRVESAFSSELVDVAYIESIDDNVAIVIPDDGIDLSNKEDEAWIIEIIARTLGDNGERRASLNVVTKRE